MKKILVIGATSGIGRRLVEMYAARGEVRVGVMGRRKELLQEFAERCPDSMASVCDLAGPEAELVCALEDMEARLGGIDCLILAAGTGCVNPALDYALERPALLTILLGW